MIFSSILSGHRAKRSEDEVEVEGAANAVESSDNSQVNAPRF